MVDAGQVFGPELWCDRQKKLAEEPGNMNLSLGSDTQ